LAFGDALERFAGRGGFDFQLFKEKLLQFHGNSSRQGNSAPDKSRLRLKI
jgi:hypothetical protein